LGGSGRVWAAGRDQGGERLVCGLADARHARHVGRIGERAVGSAILDDALGQSPANSAKLAQLVNAGRVEIDHGAGLSGLGRRGLGPGAFAIGAVAIGSNWRRLLAHRGFLSPRAAPQRAEAANGPRAVGSSTARL
jgi:hypothetical protein